MNDAIEPGFGDALLEDLPVLRFLVVHQLVGVDRLVELAGVGVDATLAEQRFHAERPRLVGDDRHDVLAQLLVASSLVSMRTKAMVVDTFATAGALVNSP
jgi:hypothetical protein